MKDVITENYQLMFGDCLERMKEIPDGSVDVCISDIPYGIDFEIWSFCVYLGIYFKSSLSPRCHSNC